MKKTRMHSSRSRTARLLTVSQHVLLGAWVYLPMGFTYLGGYLPRGGVPAWGVYLPKGRVPTQGWGTCPGGVPARGCTCPGTPLPL